MERTMTDEGARRLRGRAPLPVDPQKPIAVKRDVHELVVDVEAARFAAAFRDVVTDPESTFGLIRVKRPAERMGRDFAVGERFQGCFSLELAAGRRLPWLARLLAKRGPQKLVTWIEDQMLSNYAEVVSIEARPGDVHVLVYRYLEGTPIAGSSEFVIEPAGPGRCRVRQIFEYQEVNALALGTFQSIGLKWHDGVVKMEIEKAAARAGGRVIEDTIPESYR
ncbi:MAG TPA: hypothetical protein VKE22_20665 [Haliangiales bacterium]|nr:hypothetical protein [Haliangiales bacterium]